MKLFLSIVVIFSAVVLQEWHIGMWTFKNAPSSEFQITPDEAEKTKGMLKAFYLDLRSDQSFEMELKGTIHTGTYKISADQTILKLQSNTSGTLRFSILRKDEKEMVLNLFNVYTILVEKTNS